MIAHPKHIGMRKPFYPRLKTGPTNGSYLGQKPRGMYLALGAMWFEFENDGMMSHISKLGHVPGRDGVQTLSDDRCSEAENTSLAISHPNAASTTGISAETVYTSATNSSSMAVDVPTTNNILETGGSPLTDSDTQMDFEPALRLLEIVTMNVSPNVFTWEVSATAATNKNKILVVDCKQQWDAVEAAFGVPGTPYEHQLNWDKLSKAYAGIDVRIGETKMSDGPVWVIGWDCIGPCIWDLAAVEAELEVRTAGKWTSAVAWIKAQEAKATSLQVLLGSGTKQGDEEEEREAFIKSCLYMERLQDAWWDVCIKEYEDKCDNEVEAGVKGNRDKDVDAGEDEHEHDNDIEGGSNGADKGKGDDVDHKHADSNSARERWQYVKGGESYSDTDFAIAFVRTFAPSKLRRNEAILDAYKTQAGSGPQEGMVHLGMVSSVLAIILGCLLFLFACLQFW